MGARYSTVMPVQEVGLPGVNDFTFLWIIENIKNWYTKELFTIRSEIFTVHNNVRWQMTLTCIAGYMRFSLACKESFVSENMLQMRVFVLDSKLNKTPIASVGYLHYPQIDSAAYIPLNKVLNESEHLLINGDLVLFFHVTVASLSKDIQVKCTPNFFHLNAHLSDSLQCLLESGSFADFNIIAKGESHPCHKFMLSCRSQYFAALFTHDFKEKGRNELVMSDIEPNILKKLLQYIYTDQVTITESDCLPLFVAANKYCLGRLERLCEKKIVSSFSFENAVRVSDFADRYGTGRLSYVTKRFTKAFKKQLVVLHAAQDEHMDTTGSPTSHEWHGDKELKHVATSSGQSLAKAFINEMCNKEPVDVSFASACRVTSESTAHCGKCVPSAAGSECNIKNKLCVKHKKGAGSHNHYYDKWSWIPESDTDLRNVMAVLPEYEFSRVFWSFLSFNSSYPNAKYECTVLEDAKRDQVHATTGLEGEFFKLWNHIKENPKPLRDPSENSQTEASQFLPVTANIMCRSRSRDLFHKKLVIEDFLAYCKTRDVKKFHLECEDDELGEISRWQLKLIIRAPSACSMMHCCGTKDSKCLNITLIQISGHFAHENAHFELSILNKNGKSENVSIRPFFHYATSSCDKSFVRVSHIKFDPTLLQNDNLVISCTVRLQDSVIFPSVPCVPMPESKLREDVISLFNEETTSDITFVVRGQRFRCHKALIAIYCPNIYQKLLNSLTSSAQVGDHLRVRVDNADPVAFEKVLRHSYAGGADHRYSRY